MARSWQEMRAHAVPTILLGVLTLLNAVYQAVPGETRPSGKQDPAGKAKAEELLREARAAAGGENALRQIASLSVSLSMRRFISYIYVESSKTARQRERVLDGNISIEMQFPGRFRKKVSTTTLSGNKYSYLEIVNGDRAWRDPPLQAASSGPDHRSIDVGDFDRSAADQEQSARQQFSFYTLAWFIRNLPGDQLRFSFDSRLQVDDGPTDLLTVEGLTHPPLQLLLDRETHLLMGFNSIMRATLTPQVIVDNNVFNRREFERMRAKAREIRKAQVRTQQLISIQTRLSDRRRVGGILIPHRMITTVEGKVYEELVITKIEINRRLNPKDFELKPQKR